MDVVSHLASIPGGSAEQQYELARRVKLDATTTLLEQGKAQVEAGRLAPVLLFASTIAVFGAMPALVTDETLPRPPMSYGVQKLIGEALVADFSRRCWVDGRSLRLLGVLARPPARTGQLCAFMSDIIRRTDGWAAVHLPDLAAGHDLGFVAGLRGRQPAARSHHGGCRAEGAADLTLPTLRFSMAELVVAIAQVHGTDTKALVRYAPNERIETMFGRFPPLETAAADAEDSCTMAALLTSYGGRCRRREATGATCPGAAHSSG